MYSSRIVGHNGPDFHRRVLSHSRRLYWFSWSDCGWRFVSSWQQRL